MDEEGEWLGVGLYTAAEGARLLDLPVGRVRRWLGGYRAAGRAHPRLWQPQLPKLDGWTGLGSADLMEVDAAVRCRRAGRGLAIADPDQQPAPPYPPCRTGESRSTPSTRSKVIFHHRTK